MLTIFYYPTSEVRDGGRDNSGEEWPRWTMQKRGQEEVHLAQGQGWRLRLPGCDGAGAAERTPRPRSGVAAETSYTTPEVRGGSREEQTHVQEGRLRGHRRAERSYSMFKVRRGGHEEIPLVQDKEQRLHFAGAAMKRYPQVQGKRSPSKMVGVARGHQRSDTMKP